MAGLNIAGIVDGSTLDYPGKVAAVIYLCGCPYRCPWCQNPEILDGGGICKTLDIDYIVSALKDDFLIGAACVTGGEPLMQEDTIKLLEEIKKETSLLLKLDTNGYYPERLKKALPHVDLLSIDIKAPLGEAYCDAAGLGENCRKAVENIKKSLESIKEWKGESEARTTIVPGMTDKKETIEEIAAVVKETGFRYYTLQQFRPMNTLDPAYMKKKSPSHALMLELGKAAKEYLPAAKVKIFTEKKGFEEM